MYKPNIEGVIVYLHPVLDSAQRSFNYKVLRLILPFVCFPAEFCLFCLMIQHHPALDLLIKYAGKRLNEPLSLLIATHMSLCPRCQQEVRALELISDTLPDPQPLEMMERKLLLTAIQDRISSMAKPEVAPTPQPYPTQTPSGNVVDWPIPTPLKSYIPQGINHLSWSQTMGATAVSLPVNDDDSYTASLFWLRVGKTASRHTHTGVEFIMPLIGSVADNRGVWHAGDVQVNDFSVTHSPIVGTNMDCLCLGVSSGEAKFVSFWDRFKDFLGTT